MRKTALALFTIFIIGVLLVSITSAQYSPQGQPVPTRNSHVMATPHPYQQPTLRPVCIITQTYYHCGGSVRGNPDAQVDPLPHETGVTTIYIPAPDGMYMLEVIDGFGNWSLVTDTEHPKGIVFQAHDGFIELIGNSGQPTDYSSYRLIEIQS